MKNPDKHNVRALLAELGVGDFNATMSIPYMFLAPRTTDPAAVQLIVVLKQMQYALASMGAVGIVPSGVLDEQTGAAIAQICGPEWLSMPYYEIVRCVVNAERDGYQFVQPVDAAPLPMSGVFDFLPDVPGGMLTYAVGGYLLYRYLKKRKRR